MYHDYIALTNNSADYLSLLRPFNLRNGLKILVRNLIIIWFLGRGAFHVLCYLKLHQLRIALISYLRLWTKAALSCIIINLALWSWNHLIVLQTNFQVHFQTDIVLVGPNDKFSIASDDAWVLITWFHLLMYICITRPQWVNKQH